eukprot:CAMPEP_0172541996 /NCGR_PEP_ID=MMETSP1067-20121228/12693_1 /TAXON_ID=265564 ORGANISM="Thalassiosira punctigera, Strain Tpunct2005C2" /NCGR_SAMPLE_ID=MMETSP1067 /ASSEMBLY_ACC=CAM_ASM_000444 /LENGTH=935 /DNA_ID=CAMNT_0013328143 /DNA_START=181 /DNA_END=2991 /DNA_ORIENTATION=-
MASLVVTTANSTASVMSGSRNSGSSHGSPTSASANSGSRGSAADGRRSKSGGSSRKSSGGGSSRKSSGGSSRKCSGSGNGKPSSNRSSSTSLASKRSNATSAAATEGDVAAMRHLRSIVESMAANNALPPSAFDRSSDKKVANNFEQLLENAEKRIHFNERKRNDDPLQLLNTPDPATVANGAGRKKKGWLKARFAGKNRQQMQQQQQRGGVQNLAAGASLTMTKVPSDRRNRKSFAGALETLEEEGRGEVEDTRGSGSDLGGDGSGSPRAGGTDPAKTPRTAALEEEVLAGPALEEESANDAASEMAASEVAAVGDEVENDDDTADTATDSIVAMRLKNSEDYTASVCSIRSLSTFERDFVENIATEQAAQQQAEAAQNEDASVSTFEKDFMAREAKGENQYPTQVFTTDDGAMEVDDLTADATVHSETTFERDARLLRQSDDAPPPMNITTNSDINNRQTGDDDDDITLDTIQSETTFEMDQRQRAEAAMGMEGDLERTGSAAATAVAMLGTFVNTVRSAMSNESEQSVSTYEKDAAALKFLATKIGRTPSTKSKERRERSGVMGSVAEEILEDEGSERSTSTFEQDQEARERLKAAARKPGGGAATPAASSNLFVPRNLGIGKSPSEVSCTSFERDVNARALKKQLSAVVEGSHSRATSPRNSPRSQGGAMVARPPLSPNLSTAAVAQAQMQQLPQTQPMIPPRQLRVEPEIVSPLSVPTVCAPSFGMSPLGSPPSRTAFENDTVRGGRKGDAPTSNNPEWFDGRSDPRTVRTPDPSTTALDLQNLSVPSANGDAGNISLSGYERDARAVAGSVHHPANSVRQDASSRSHAPTVQSTIATAATASAYDGAAPVAPDMAGNSPGADACNTGLSIAARGTLAAARARAQARQAALPKISPLVVELSPNAIDRGVKLQNREGGGFLSRFMCFTGS